jgi:hypothetical protein
MKKTRRIIIIAKRAAANSCILAVLIMILVMGRSLSTINAYNQLNTAIRITMGNTIKAPPNNVVFKNDFIAFNFLPFC